MLPPVGLPAPPGWLLPSLALVIGAALPLYAWRVRGRVYAGFAGVVVLLSFPAALLLAEHLQALLGPLAGWGFVYAFGAAGVHHSGLVRARLRRPLYRYALSLPGMALVALGALCVPYFAARALCWGLFELLGAAGAQSALRWLDLLPPLVIALSLATSLRLRREIVRIELGGATPEVLTRLPLLRHRHRPRRAARARARARVAPRGDAAPLRDSPARPLRIVQITDPHLGPWQPLHRLRRRIEELLGHNPDLVLLTGDFLTMEGNGTPGALAQALAPLADAPGRCFACLGNHDHEALHEVQSALAECGVSLLVDDAAQARTPLGPVQILGADFHRRGRSERLAALFARFPRQAGRLRLLLLHDPMHFRDVPKNEVDLALSGHTHGGQIGLVSLGFNWTVLSRSPWPDHGLFGHGASRLYVHRGTGFYGFPLRIGVPGEASLLELVPAKPAE